ncbi:putative inositol phosphokinase (IPK) family protein [Lyophyllum shimeji]|uniref:Kinase n=1 Tax=Lyophyllum shimeji TaxID=47721 RepID=A0A9P3PGV4_LYOSH|nr:putative inositol phosphokinase (IPK) family protein [Lyophyllum shimeji]
MISVHMQPAYHPACSRSCTAFKVMGHAGMRTTGPDGSLIIKPAFPAEHRFYEMLNRDPHLARLRPFIPKFLGTLESYSGSGSQFLKAEAEAEADSNGFLVPIPVPPGRTQSLILENLCSAFVKPNTLDVKLGTVFYDEFMAEDKVLRMERTARETTSRSTGVRLTEFQVYDNVTSEAICVPKSYGKALAVSELPEGIARFFPVHCEPSSSALHNGNGAVGPSPSRGLPRKTLIPILRAIRQTVSKIRDVYASFEMRMVGGSLLIMYEADWSRAEAGVRRLLASSSSSMPRPIPIPSSGEEDWDRAHTHRSPSPCVVKLVDFAHTRLAPGEGPDEGVLLGLDTMLKLLDGRIAQLTAGASEECTC